MTLNFDTIRKNVADKREKENTANAKRNLDRIAFLNKCQSDMQKEFREWLVANEPDFTRSIETRGTLNTDGSISLKMGYDDTFKLAWSKICHKYERMVSSKYIRTDGFDASEDFRDTPAWKEWLADSGISISYSTYTVTEEQFDGDGNERPDKHIQMPLWIISKV